MEEMDRPGRDVMDAAIRVYLAWCHDEDLDPWDESNVDEFLDTLES